MFFQCFGRTKQIFNVCSRYFNRTRTNYELEVTLEKKLAKQSFVDFLTDSFHLFEQFPETEAYHQFCKKNGFIPNVTISSATEGGAGVFLEGSVGAGQIVGIYPGLIYEPGDPSFFPSLKNDYSHFISFSHVLIFSREIICPFLTNYYL